MRVARLIDGTLGAEMLLRVTAVVVLATLVSDRALSCSCGKPEPTATVATSYSSAVVTGIVTNIHGSTVTRRAIDFAGNDVPLLNPISEVEINVTQVFKGPKVRHLSLSLVGCCVCEFRFEEGKEYLIFVTTHSVLKGHSMASFCLPTEELSKATSSLQELGAPIATYKPMKSQSAIGRASSSFESAISYLVRQGVRHEETEDEPLRWYFSWVLLFLALPVAAVAIWFKRKRLWRA